MIEDEKSLLPSRLFWARPIKKCPTFPLWGNSTNILKKKRLYWKFSGWHKCVPLLKLFEGGGGTKNFSKSDRRMTGGKEQTKTQWNICFKEEGSRPNVCMFICQKYFFVCTSIAYFNQLLFFCISETVGSSSPFVWRSWSTSLLGWTSFAWEEYFCHRKMFLKMKKYTLNIKHKKAWFLVNLDYNCHVSFLCNLHLSACVNWYSFLCCSYSHVSLLNFVASRGE